jgi:hypothetical protein
MSMHNTESRLRAISTKFQPMQTSSVFLQRVPSEQWQVTSFRLIPLLTHVSFRCTVPLSTDTLGSI